MFRLYVEKNRISVQEREPVTSGSVNAYRVGFGFSGDWEGLERVAIFRCAKETASVLLDGSGECAVPWKVLRRPGFRLEAGVYGSRGGEVVLPTVWANLGVVLTGAGVPEDGAPPAPELWEQALSRKGDGLGYTEAGELGLYAGEKLLSSVPLPSSGEGGTTDHRVLSHRDAERQHPIASIDGLAEELKRIPAPAEALTNEDLEGILR